MHRHLLVAVLMILATAAFTQAQIVIDAREVPSTPGMEFNYYTESDSVEVDLGAPGGPQVWDFTAGDTTETSTDLYLDPSSSPPQYERANVVIQTDELNIAGVNEPGKMYCYLHRLRFIVGALETTYEGTTVDFTLTPYLTQYTLPMQMGNTWSNTLDIDQIIEFPEYDIRIELYATMDSEVDAYGTMQVPCGDFEALRIRNDVDYDLTVSIRFLWVWIPIYSESSQAISYDWRAEDVGLLVNATAQTNDPNFTYADKVRRLADYTVLDAGGARDLAMNTTPVSFELTGCYPNPFNSETVITYTLSEPADVTLHVYDLMGREVAVLDQGSQAPGDHEIRWQPDNLSAGMYILQLKAGGAVQVGAVVYLK